MEQECKIKKEDVEEVDNTYSMNDALMDKVVGIIKQREQDNLQKVVDMLQMQKEQDNFSSHITKENISTLHTSQLQYPTSHTFSKKYPSLNSLTIDLMDQSRGTK
jgi:hypothetical protein